MAKRTIRLAAAIFLCCAVVSCANFRHGKKDKNVKGDNTEEVAEDNAQDEVVKADPQDDAAMEKSTHLKFKGVPIDGTLDKFVERMRRGGFELVEKDDDSAVLTGDFAGFKECAIYVSTLEDKDLVWAIVVAVPERDQWEYLYGDYKYLKDMLTKKYGKPSSCVEKFQGPFGLKPTDDGDRMNYVEDDKCKYETRFKTSNGEIILWIAHDNRQCYVSLQYSDKENRSAIRDHAMEDL